jgi:MFS family permease
MTAPAPSRSLNPLRVLVKHRNFRLFWIGQTLSLMGTWMQGMAQGWLALELTNDPFLVTLVPLMASLPVVLFSFVAGAVADRAHKLRIVVIAQALLLVEAAVLWWLAWTGAVTIWWLFGMAMFSGACSAFEIPARQALIIDLVGRDDLHDAIALNSSGFNLARIIGPAIGAAVIASAGLAWCFALNAVSYLAVLAGLAMIRLPRRVPAEVLTSPFQEIRDGIRYMVRTRAVRVLMLLVTVYSVFGIPFLSLMPVVARDVVHTDAAGFGLMLSSVGIGGFLGALALAALGGRIGRGRLLAWSSAAFGAALLGFSFVRSQGWAQPVLLLCGVTMILHSALANGMLQLLVPDAMRGRLMAAYSFVVVGVSQVAGNLGAGTVAKAIGADWAIGTGAVVMLAYSAWVFRRHPDLMRG